MPPDAPTYAELLRRTDAPPGSSWGIFGPADELGSLNFLDGDRAARAASLVRRGRAFNLDYPLDAFSPSVSPYRRPPRHRMVTRHEGAVRDDYVEDLYLQGSSQIDGLRHHRHPRHGNYGGIPDAEIEAGSTRLGIHNAAEKGIVGRGVVLDVERYLASEGSPPQHLEGPALSVDLLERVAASQGTIFETGDVLLMHTGWCRCYLEDLDDEQRSGLVEARVFTGLGQSTRTLEWLWDHQFAMVATDTVAVEVMPAVDESPFHESVNRMMHPDLIALLGLHLGELWNLDGLALDCASDGVYECMVVAKPLNLRGGVGSPANALAVK